MLLLEAPGWEARPPGYSNIHIHHLEIHQHTDSESSGWGGVFDCIFSKLQVRVVLGWSMDHTLSSKELVW